MPTGRVLAGDAAARVADLLLEEPRPAYHYIIHDVFSGTLRPAPSAPPPSCFWLLDFLQPSIAP